MAYADSKDLSTTTASEKVLCNKAFGMDQNPKLDGYQRDLASMVYMVFGEKSKGGAKKY